MWIYLQTSSRWRKGKVAFRLLVPPSYLLHLLLSDSKLDPGGPEPQGELWAAKDSPATGTCQGHAKVEGFRKASLDWDAGCRCVWGAGMEVRGLKKFPPAEPTPSEPWKVGEGATGPRISRNLEVVWAGAPIHPTAALGPGKETCSRSRNAWQGAGAQRDCCTGCISNGLPPGATQS